MLIAISMMILVIPVMAKPPTYEITYYQTQFQWRGYNEAFGDWTAYPEGGDHTDVRLTEDVLHCWMEYTPNVWGKPRGMSHIYVNDGNDHWTLHDGKMSYRYDKLYGPYRAVNYFRGYMEFSGTPSTSTFVRGALYQWIYVMEPQNEPVDDEISGAVFCPVMKAWLVGFSVYIQDPQKPTTPHTLDFPGPLTAFPRPVPANNDNPLDL